MSGGRWRWRVPAKWGPGMRMAAGMSMCATFRAACTPASVRLDPCQGNTGDTIQHRRVRNRDHDVRRDIT
eukprot:9499771-Pyramimonas_sp.AAC.1